MRYYITNNTNTDNIEIISAENQAPWSENGIFCITPLSDGDRKVNSIRIERIEPFNPIKGFNILQKLRKASDIQEELNDGMAYFRIRRVLENIQEASRRVAAYKIIRTLEEMVITSLERDTIYI